MESRDRRGGRESNERGGTMVKEMKEKWETTVRRMVAREKRYTRRKEDEEWEKKEE